MVFALSAVFAVAFLAGCGEKQEEAEPVVRPVKTVVVGEAFMGTRSFPGRIEASERVEMSFRVSGPLVELPIDRGQDVKKGQLLARIDPRDFETRIAGIESRIGEAQAQLDAMETGARPVYEGSLRREFVAGLLRGED